MHAPQRPHPAAHPKRCARCPDIFQRKGGRTGPRSHAQGSSMVNRVLPAISAQPRHAAVLNTHFTKAEAVSPLGSFGAPTGTRVNPRAVAVRARASGRRHRLRPGQKGRSGPGVLRQPGQSSLRPWRRWRTEPEARRNRSSMPPLPVPAQTRRQPRRPTGPVLSKRELPEEAEPDHTAQHLTALAQRQEPQRCHSGENR